MITDLDLSPVERLLNARDKFMVVFTAFDGPNEVEGTLKEGMMAIISEACKELDDIAKEPRKVANGDLSDAERALIAMLRSPPEQHRRIMISLTADPQPHWTVHTKDKADRQGNGKTFDEAWKEAAS